jgi:hypothetical protein
VIQPPAVLSPEFGAKSSHIYTQSPENGRVVCGINCLECPDDKENYEHALDFALHLSRLSWSR